MSERLTLGAAVTEALNRNLELIAKGLGTTIADATAWLERLRRRGLAGTPSAVRQLSKTFDRLESATAAADDSYADALATPTLESCREWLIWTG